MRKTGVLISILIAMFFIVSCKKKEIANNNTPIDTFDFRDAIVGNYSCYKANYKHDVWMDSTGNWQSSNSFDTAYTPIQTIEFQKGDSANWIKYGSDQYYPVNGNIGGFRKVGTDLSNPLGTEISFDTINKKTKFLYAVSISHFGGVQTSTYLGNKIP